LFVREGDTVKLIGILCWFDERPSWLAGVIGGLRRVGVEHLVAVDGAYGLYPGGRPYSGPEQHDTIVETSRALDIATTIHTPREPYWGNEVEKRNLAFALAETIAEPNVDWYFLVDADHFVTVAEGHHKQLAETGCDVGQVRMMEPYGALLSAGPLRCVFRAIPGLRFETAHMIYRTPDGRDLHELVVPAVDLCIDVEHRTAERDRYRKELQQDYYRRRDEMGVEAAA
jgi:hypothetical protein